MIIIDLSNLVFSAVLDFNTKTGEQVDMHVIRNLCIDRLKTLKNKLKEFDDEIVLAVDSRHYWRKNVFPLYKANRKKDRDKSKFDWPAFFPMFDQFKQELKEYFPVKFIEVEGAEADDIMAVLSSRYGPHRSVCLATSDNDMIQIQQHACSTVKQWSPWHKKFLTPKNSEYDLFEHICSGDTGDGVPNILSDDDALANPEKRQKGLRKLKVADWSKHGINGAEYFCPDTEALRKFERNKQLIDLRCIPDDIASKIVEEYENAVPAKGKMFTYLSSNRLTKILKDGGF